MRHVEFEPTRLTGEQEAEWRAWEVRARAATERAIDEWETQDKVSWDDEVWGDLKKWLLENVFHNKCAYCESPAVRDPGAAEHFRPKGRVTESEMSSRGKKKKIRVKIADRNGNEIEHPGYFWLAYNWKNLLPACFACNTTGKSDRFPTKTDHKFLVRLAPAEVANLKSPPIESKKWPGYYYLSPEDLDELEEPLILHPYRDYPERHLRFGYQGIEAPVNESEIGKASIETYNLDSDPLRQARQAEQNAAYVRFLIAMANRQGNKEENLQAGCAAVSDYIQGKMRYSAAACDWIEENFSKSIRT